MYCYSNHGLSMRCVDANHSASADEVLFSDYATPTQLAAAFPQYTSSISVEAVKLQISALEEQVTPRMLREAIAGDISTNPATGLTSAATVQSINAQIKALRAQLA